MKTTLLEIGHYNKFKECRHELFYGRSLCKIDKLLYEEDLLYKLRKLEGNKNENNIIRSRILQ